MHRYMDAGFLGIGSGFGLYGGYIVALLALVALVVALALLRRSRAASKRPGLDIASERYARGEIDREEYAKLKADLKR